MHNVMSETPANGTGARMLGRLRNIILNFLTDEWWRGKYLPAEIQPSVEPLLSMFPEEDAVPRSAPELEVTLGDDFQVLGKPFSAVA